MRRAAPAVALAALAVAAAPAAAAPWRTVKLSPRTALGPSVELDGRGRGVVAWLYLDLARTLPNSPRPDPASARIEVAEVDARSGRVRRIATFRDPGARAPFVAVNSRGDAIVAWQWSDPACADSLGCRQAYRVAIRRARGRFGRPRTLGAGPTSVTAHVGLGERGEGVFAWDDRRGSRPAIALARLRAGARRFDRPRRLVGGAESFVAATSPEGETVFAWERRIAGDRLSEPARIEYLSLRAGRASRPRALSPGGGERSASIAIAPGGAVQVAWRDLGPRRADGPGYAGPETIRTAFRPRRGRPFRATGSLPAANGPFAVAVARDGSAAVSQGDPPDRPTPPSPFAIGPWTMEVALRRAGQPFGSFQRLSDDGVGVPAVEFDRRARALAVWTPHENRSILAADAPRGGPFRAPATLAGDGGQIGGPDVEVAPGGAAALAWHESAGERAPVRGWLALRSAP
jgi:hypothetical protein